MKRLCALGFLVASACAHEIATPPAAPQASAATPPPSAAPTTKTVPKRVPVDVQLGVHPSPPLPPELAPCVELFQDKPLGSLFSCDGVVLTAIKYPIGIDKLQNPNAKSQLKAIPSLHNFAQLLKIRPTQRAMGVSQDSKATVFAVGDSNVTTMFGCGDAIVKEALSGGCRRLLPLFAVAAENGSAVSPLTSTLDQSRWSGDAHEMKWRSNSTTVEVHPLTARFESTTAQELSKIFVKTGMRALPDRDVYAALAVDDVLKEDHLLSFGVAVKYNEFSGVSTSLAIIFGNDNYTFAARCSSTSYLCSVDASSAVLESEFIANVGAGSLPRILSVFSRDTVS
jgi:hypothetical protein